MMYKGQPKRTAVRKELPLLSTHETVRLFSCSAPSFAPICWHAARSHGRFIKISRTRPLHRAIQSHKPPGSTLRCTSAQSLPPIPLTRQSIISTMTTVLKLETLVLSAIRAMVVVNMETALCCSCDVYYYKTVSNGSGGCGELGR